MQQNNNQNNDTNDVVDLGEEMEAIMDNEPTNTAALRDNDDIVVQDKERDLSDTFDNNDL